MKKCFVTLGFLLCGLPSLPGQSAAPASPPEIKPQGETATEASKPRLIFPWHGTRREMRQERRRGRSSPAASADVQTVSTEWDSNRDGKVSLSEFLQHQRELAESQARASFTEKDRNHDGQLTPDEFPSTAPQPAASKSRRLISGVEANTPESKASAPSPAPEPHPFLEKGSTKAPPSPTPKGGAVEIAPPPSNR